MGGSGRYSDIFSSMRLGATVEMSGLPKSITCHCDESRSSGPGPDEVIRVDVQKILGFFLLIVNRRMHGNPP
jgi:hypothetical protein